ncbi:MAG: hypothetical protein J7K12_03430 [Thermoplasmata archaeon]|nr:hypothetical protein [Thermoplasmata archaeon]
MKYIAIAMALLFLLPAIMPTEISHEKTNFFTAAKNSLRNENRERKATMGGIDQSQHNENGFFKLYGGKSYAQSFMHQKYLRLDGMKLLVSVELPFLKDCC